MKLSDQPVAYSAAFKAVLALLVILGVVELTPEQIGAAVLALDAVLAVFVWRAVTPNARAEAAAAKKAPAKKAVKKTR